MAASEEALLRFDDTARMRALYVSSCVGVVAGEGSRILDANDEFLRIIDRTRSELEGGLDWRELTPPEHLPADDALIEPVRTGGGATLVKEYWRKDGQRVPVLISGVGLDDEPFRWMSIVVDLSEGHRLQAMSQNEGALFDAMLTASPVGLAFVDQDLRFVRVNESLAEFACTTPSAAIGRRVDDVIQGDPGRIVTEWVELVLSSARPVLDRDLHGSLATADPDYEAVVHVYPIGSRERGITGAGVAIMDVTGRKRLEREAKSALKERIDVQDAVLDHVQRTHLPAIPQVPGLAISARYLPAESAARIGGDWYDCFMLDDGRLVLSVGDATGHGLEAVSTMSAARHALRTLLITGQSVTEAVAHTNLVLRHHDLATAVVAVLSLDTGVLEYVIAGHPPPLLRRDDGTVEVLAHTGGPLLGAFSESTYRSGQITLSAGDTLVLYTDGLIQGRRENIDAGIARLGAALSTVDPCTGHPLAALVIAGALGGQRPDDDICVLAVTRHGVATSE